MRNKRKSAYLVILSRIEDSGTMQVFAQVEPEGDGVAGLFNTSTNLSAADDTISTTAAALGLPSDRAGYRVQDLWSPRAWWAPSSGTITAEVPSEGPALYRVTPV